MNRKIKVVLLEPNKLARIKEIDASLEGMQKVVGGLIEPAYYFDDPVCMVVKICVQISARIFCCLFRGFLLYCHGRKVVRT